MDNERVSNDPPQNLSRNRGSSVLRLLEYSGLGLILAILAGTASAPLSLTDILDASGLCNATAYSAISLAVGLGLVNVNVGTERYRRVVRYSSTETGRRVGKYLLDIESMLRPARDSNTDDILLLRRRGDSHVSRQPVK